MENTGIAQGKYQLKFRLTENPSAPSRIYMVPLDARINFERYRNTPFPTKMDKLYIYANIPYILAFILAPDFSILLNSFPTQYTS